MTNPVVKTWRLLPHDPVAVQRLAASLRVAPVTAQLLLNRGLTTQEECRRFLDSPLAGLHAPELLPGVPAAAERILAAVRAGKHLCVYGDYDVDGLSGAAILLQGLRLLQAHVCLYVPHRLEEGYGLNIDALRQLAADGVHIVITVDCGIASLAEAEEARRLGLELIVTDHHEFKAQLPRTDVLVHPRLPGTSYPFGKLSGSAVAFKLAWALAKLACGGDKVTPRFRDYLLDSIALASLGVVADVVPLHDENRILVRHGLARLRQSSLPGLHALCRASGLQDGSAPRSSDIGFRLAPRLNAAGRLGCARRVVDLLTTSRPELAEELARGLEDDNLERQRLEREMIQQARRQAEDGGLIHHPALVLAYPGWHPGVLGIVAGRMADLYGRPALMISLPAGTKSAGSPAVGSGRSIPGFALNEALQACDDLLLGHGGHPMAAGFRLLPEQVTAFRDRLCAHCGRHYPDGPPRPSLVLDAEVPLSILTFGLLQDLDRLEPYGAENRRPLFLAGPLELGDNLRKVGQTQRHLSFSVRQQKITLKAIAFGMADRVEELQSGGGVCFLAFTPRLNEWNGRRAIDLEVADFQAGAEVQLG